MEETISYTAAILRLPHPHAVLRLFASCIMSKWSHLAASGALFGPHSENTRHKLNELCIQVVEYCAGRPPGSVREKYGREAYNYLNLLTQLSPALGGFNLFRVTKRHIETYHLLAVTGAALAF